jgi:hypothetical protein
MTDVAKVGDVVLDGLQTLFSMKEVEPVLGQRIELAPDILKGLPERQVALINGSSVSGQGLKLQSNRLLDANGAQYSAADFLVYSLGGLPSVEAESVLPFDAEANKMYETASAGDDTSWQRAKAELITLYRRLRASPDLTTADAERLFEVYRAQLLKIKKIIENTTLLGDEKDLKDFISRSSNAAENTVLNTRANQVFEL